MQSKSERDRQSMFGLTLQPPAQRADRWQGSAGTDIRAANIRRDTNSTDRVGVLDDRRLNSGRRHLILPDGQQRTVAGDATDGELTFRYQLDRIARMPLTD
jgi:hypothetical protein